MHYLNILVFSVFRKNFSRTCQYQHYSKHAIQVPQHSTHVCTKLTIAVPIHRMKAIITPNYVTVQLWGLEHFTVPQVKMLHSIVHMYSYTCEIDRIMLMGSGIQILGIGL